MEAKPSPAARATLMEALYGFRRTALCHVAARLAIPDRIAAGARTGAELAAAIGGQPDAVQRLLRALVVIGVLVEDGAGRFELTPQGELLRRDADGSLHALAVMIGEEFMPAWANLVHSAMTGAPAFDHAFGISNWQHRAQHPDLNASFNEYLARELAPRLDLLLAAGDFARFPRIADVGGGTGTLLAAILRAQPAARGTLVEQAHVIEDARVVVAAAGVADRCELVAADFFAHVPAGADAYVLKSVLHDWGDDACVAILDRCRAAVPPHGRLILIERLLPERAEDAPEIVLLDIHMLAICSGRERTRAGFAALLERARFELIDVRPTPAGVILEAVPR